MAKTSEQAQMQRQRDAILDVLRVPGRPWMITTEIAKRTPWATRTVIGRLNKLRDQGLVEKRRPTGRHCRWRLA